MVAEHESMERKSQPLYLFPCFILCRTDWSDFIYCYQDGHVPFLLGKRSK